MKTKRVALLIETSLASGREIVGGVSRFAHERNDWSVSYHTGPLGAMSPRFLENWSGDGIIARIANPTLKGLVERCGSHVVDVLGNVAEADYPIVKCDDGAIARLVGGHFIERGYRHIAFFGLRYELWSKDRRNALEAMTKRIAGATFDVHEVEHCEREADVWPEYMKRLSLWIEGLPKPVGLMVGSDQFGPDITEACRNLGLVVPDQVSLVGVDNDLPFCEICQPQLSSVEPNHERVGYVAAKLLESKMGGEPVPADTLIEIEPKVLNVRQSSDATALNDAALVKALRFIRSNACDAIGVDEIARAAGVSRSVLQRRFRGALNKTVLEAIRAARLNRAKEMLAQTDLPLSDVAERSGFKHQEYLGYVFKKHISCTPGQYRSRAQA